MALLSNRLLSIHRQPAVADVNPISPGGFFSLGIDYLHSGQERIALVSSVVSSIQTTWRFYPELVKGLGDGNAVSANLFRLVKGSIRDCEDLLLTADLRS